MARALVAKRAIDDDEERRAEVGGDEARGRDAHERLAARGEELFGDEHRERRADGAGTLPAPSRPCTVFASLLDEADLPADLLDDRGLPLVEEDLVRLVQASPREPGFLL
jgi:hypothetical protein